MLTKPKSYMELNPAEQLQNHGAGHQILSILG
jgi:hypothetical protein